jgi:hypothetical protein
MQAMILTAPPQLLQVSMSMLNTRFKRCAQVMAPRRSAGVVSSGASAVRALLPLARLAGYFDNNMLTHQVNSANPWHLARLLSG